VAAQIDTACRASGFFSIVGHGVPEGLRCRLDGLAREFFALPEEAKAGIAMAQGGRAWRGWFPVGGELTSGRPDLKEGIYFGQELSLDDPAVLAGVPLHGPNQFPAEPPGLRAAVLDYMTAVTEVGRLVLEGIALGLGLEATWFDTHLTADPLVLFRIFHYPAPEPGTQQVGVGEHTDYGLITLLGQDASGGLEVRTTDGWVPVPPDPGAFVINIGDMLERMTGGAYRSTPHRVRNTSGADRLSFPLFLDPAWDAEVLPVPGFGGGPDRDPSSRWDGQSVFAWTGTYGDYLLGKVGKVFPDLRSQVLDDP
ncbi:MAG TPA: 2-oxoglutarate and iron-dependent oxygenase domain-containing protein, partial [Acidimicrobiales bacterium]